MTNFRQHAEPAELPRLSHSQIWSMRFPSQGQIGGSDGRELMAIDHDGGPGKALRKPGIGSRGQEGHGQRHLDALDRPECGPACTPVGESFFVPVFQVHCDGGDHKNEGGTHNPGDATPEPTSGTRGPQTCQADGQRRATPAAASGMGRNLGESSSPSGCGGRTSAFTASTSGRRAMHAAKKHFFISVLSCWGFTS